VNILVLSPHSDDAELGCGGYISKMIDQGHFVVVMLMATRTVNMLHQGTVTSLTRLKESEAAMDVLGVSRFQIAYPNLKHDLTCLDKSVVVSLLDEVVDHYQISDMFVPLPGFHQEHIYTYDCGVAVARPTRFRSPLRNVYAYESPGAFWGPTEVRGGVVYADITDKLDIKLKALQCHKSQMYREGQSLISLDSVRSLAKQRGFECGYEFAERFVLLRGML